MNYIKCLALAALLGLTGGAWGAQTRVIKDFLGAPIIEIRGEIKRGDLDQIQEAAAKVLLEQSGPVSVRRPLQFQINTPGGDVVEAIKIGRFFREVLAGVQSYGKLIYATGSDAEVALASKKGDPEYEFLPVNEPLDESHIVRNHSSGILIFYGGVKRAHRDNSDQRSTPRNITVPVMGIHRPYYSREYYAGLSPAQAQEAYSKLEGLVRGYLAEMGAPQTLIDRMFMKSSNEIELIGADEFRKLYKAEESFFQEWLLARCGAKGPEHALAEAEVADFRKIEQFQIRSRLQDGPLTKPIGFIYSDPNYPKPYIESLNRLVKSHNIKVESCNGTAVNQHQLDWATAYMNKSKRR